MEIRIFGSNGCSRCNALVKGLERYSIPYSYIDALAAETQKFCDDNHVNYLPHVQIILDDHEIVFEHIGYVNPLKIKKILSSND